MYLCVLMYLLGLLLFIVAGQYAVFATKSFKGLLFNSFLSGFGLGMAYISVAFM